MKQSSATETTQPCSSNEPCGKLRKHGFDETSTLVDARQKLPHSRMLAQMVRPRNGKRQLTEGGLFPTHTFLNWEIGKL